MFRIIRDNLFALLSVGLSLFTVEAVDVEGSRIRMKVGIFTIVLKDRI
jgi:hypothetical protein